MEKSNEDSYRIRQETLQNIGDAIREKLSSTGEIPPAGIGGMSDKIRSITTASLGTLLLKTPTIKFENNSAVISASADLKVRGVINSAPDDANARIPLQEVTVTSQELVNTSKIVVADQGNILSKVSIEPVLVEQRVFTENGTFRPEDFGKNGYLWNGITINVASKGYTEPAEFELKAPRIEGDKLISEINVIKKGALEENAISSTTVTVVPATIVIPSSEIQTIASAGSYLSGDIKVGSVVTTETTVIPSGSAQTITATIPFSKIYVDQITSDQVIITPKRETVTVTGSLYNKVIVNPPKTETRQVSAGANPLEVLPLGEDTFLSKVIVNPISTVVWQEKTITPSLAEPLTITADYGYDGLSKVTVEKAPLPPSEQKEGTPGDNDVDVVPTVEGFLMSRVTIKPPILQSFTPVTPSIERIEITADQNKFFKTVTIDPPVTSVTTVVPADERKEYSPDEGMLFSKVIVEPPTMDNIQPVNPSDVQQYIIAGNDRFLKTVVVNAVKSSSTTVYPMTTTHTYAPSEGFYSAVTVDAIQIEEKTVTPTDSQQSYTPSSGKFFNKFTVNAISTTVQTAEPTTVTKTYTPTAGWYFNKFTVNGIKATNTTTTPSTATLTVNPPTGYNYLTKVEVAAIKATNTTVTPSASSITVTPPSGYNYLTKVDVTAIKATNTTVTPSTSSITVTPPSGYNYLTQVIVNKINATTAIATPATTTVTVNPPTNYDYLTEVTVNPISVQTKTMTVNGSCYPDSGEYLSRVDVSIPTYSLI